MTTYSLHPGAVRTEIGRNLNAAYFRGARSILNVIAVPFFKSAEEGAQTTIYCAVDETLADTTGEKLKHWWKGHNLAQYKGIFWG